MVPLAPLLFDHRGALSPPPALLPARWRALVSAACLYIRSAACVHAYALVGAVFICAHPVGLSVFWFVFHAEITTTPRTSTVLGGEHSCGD